MYTIMYIVILVLPLDTSCKLCHTPFTRVRSILALSGPLYYWDFTLWEYVWIKASEVLEVLLTHGGWNMGDLKHALG